MSLDAGTRYQIELERLDEAWDVAGWDEFDNLPASQQNAAWALLAHRAEQHSDGAAVYEGIVDIPVQRTIIPLRTWTPPKWQDKGRELDTIPTDRYVYQLTGEEVSPGKRCDCPLPDHEDSSRDFAMVRGSDMNWCCYGCNRGGTIFQFAALLWGIHPPLRGDTFREVRDRLAGIFG